MNRISFTSPGALLRIEALAVLALTVDAYARLFPGRWGLFALLFLVPDVTLMFFAFNSSQKTIASAAYNLAHTYAMPVVLGLLAWPAHVVAMRFALIWTAHIAFDRTLGYGLKYPGSFKHTHLQQAIHSDATVV